MKKNLVFLLLAITCQVFAQTNLITGIKISLPTNPNSNTAEWANEMPPIMISAQTRMENGKVSPMVMESSILVSIKGNGAVCGHYSVDNAPASNFNSPAKVWSGEMALNLLGEACVLKPGIYEFCVKFYANGAVGQVLIGEACKSFTIKETEHLTYQPPRLLAPANGLTYTTGDFTKPQMFRWTPVIPKPQEPVTYRLKVWQLLQGQTGTQAMRVNQPIITKDVDNMTQALINNIIDGPCKPPILCDFVWNVQALNREGKPIDSNKGTSEVFTFRIGVDIINSLNGSPTLKLVSPRNGEIIAETNPTFVWMPPMPVPPGKTTYKIKIVEIIGDQSPEEAMLRNKAFFEKEDIRMTSFQYPSSAPKFVEGKKYVWQVSSRNVMSDVSIFDRRDDTNKLGTIKLNTGGIDTIESSVVCQQGYGCNWYGASCWDLGMTSGVLIYGEPSSACFDMAIKVPGHILVNDKGQAWIILDKDTTHFRIGSDAFEDFNKQMEGKYAEANKDDEKVKLQMEREYIAFSKTDDYVVSSQLLAKISETTGFRIVKGSPKRELDEGGKMKRITLLSPVEGEEIDFSQPIDFTWSQLPDGGPYKIKIVEIIGNESPEAGIRGNKPFFEREGIRSTNFQYLPSERQFEEGKEYAWEISSGSTHSEVWSFKRKKKDYDWDEYTVIKLLSPADGDSVNTDVLIFSWEPSNSAASGPCKIKIVEIIGDQSPEEAMLRNKAFFEKDDIRQQTFQYPSSAPKFVAMKKYAWMIQCGDLRSSISIFDRGGTKIAYSWKTDYRLDNTDILEYLQTDEVIIKKGEYLFDYSTNPNGDVILPLAKPIRDIRRNKADVMFEGVPANIDCKLDGSSCVGGPRSTVGKPSFYTVKPLLTNGFIIQLILSYKGANNSLVGNQSTTKTSDMCKYLSVNFMEERKIYKGDSIAYEGSIINKYSGSELKNKPTSFRIKIMNDAVIVNADQAPNGWTRTPSKFPPGSSQIKWTNNSGDIPQGETKFGNISFINAKKNPTTIFYEWLDKDDQVLCSGTSSIRYDVHDKIQLLSPRNGEKLKTDNPIFSWKIFKVTNDREKYRLRIVEIKGNESPEQVMQRNDSFFDVVIESDIEATNGKDLFYQYPTSAPKFKPGNKYAWTIIIDGKYYELSIFDRWGNN